MIRKAVEALDFQALELTALKPDMVRYPGAYGQAHWHLFVTSYPKYSNVSEYSDMQKQHVLRYHGFLTETHAQLHQKRDISGMLTQGG